MYRLLLVLVASTSIAHADPLDAKAIAKKVEACAGEEAVASVGAIEKAETIGKRPATKVIQITGKKARGYVVFGNDSCYVVPVVGKPWAFAKGNFGNGATTAYALRSAGCGDVCVTVVSLKAADDKLLDVLPLDEDCEDSVDMKKRAVFGDRDSIELACWTSGGVDQSRADHLLDAGTGALVDMLAIAAGTAWVQTDQDPPRCRARPPGGIKVVTVGAKPALDVTTMSTPEAAEAAKVAWHSGGCEATIATRRYELDASGKRFVAKGTPKVSIAKKLCSCKR